MAAAAATHHEPFSLVTRVASPLTGGKCLVIDDERECELLLNTLQNELRIIRTKLEEAALEQNEQLNNLQLPAAHCGRANEKPTLPKQHHISQTQYKKLPLRPTLIRKRAAKTIQKLPNNKLLPSRPGRGHQDKSTPMAASTTGTTASPVLLRPPQPSVVITRPAYTLQQQQHYLDIIKKKEKQLIESSEQCKSLMETHIKQQVKEIEENNQKLMIKLHKRVEREKLNRIRKIQPPAKQNTNTKKRQPLYKSSFYEAVCKEEKMKKWFSQSGPTQQQSPSIMFSDSKRASSKHSLPPICRTPGLHHGVVDEGEESNSWAITGSQNVNRSSTTTPPPQTMITAVKPPEFIPIRNIFGDTQAKEKKKLCAHREIVQKQVDQRRALSMMYNNAQLYRQIASHMMSHDTWREIEVFTPIDSAREDLTNSEISSHLKRIFDESEQSEDDTASQEGSLPSRGTSPLTPSSVTPPLTMDQLLTNEKSNIKESVKVSSLWRRNTDL